MADRRALRGATGRDSNPLRRYPPLATVAVALGLALFALPSALNLPQANPAQTLEYAPVPGNAGDRSQSGNLGALGLGSGGGAAAGQAGQAADVLAPPPPLPSGIGGNPSPKTCVGTPPRQTEDALSPPCVAFFQGDNGGATYRGVTGGEVAILFYFEGGVSESDGSTSDTAPVDKYIDVAQQNGSDPSHWIGKLRTWMTYFNDRFQTYHRKVHFYAYFNHGDQSASGGTNYNTPQDMVKDAADNYNHLHPFAAFPEFGAGSPDAYEHAMARYGVLGFGSLVPRSASFFSQFSGLEWGFLPATDYIARSYSSFVCTKLAPNTVSFGNAADTGKKRIYGFLTTSDPNHPELQELGRQAADALNSGCGISPAWTCQHPISGYAIDPKTSPDYAATCMATFIQKGVTTILWLDGFETNFGKAAHAAQYFPEWVIEGDQVSDAWTSAFYQDASEWLHAMVVSPQELTNIHSVPQPCEEAYRSVDPSAAPLVLTFACEYFYSDLFQLFTGIQVAGPRLTPHSMDLGFHAIPAHPSSSPQVPACFYPSGDYTCIKDATAQWWDPSGWPGNGGCYRLLWGGRRYEPGGWPAGDPKADEKPADPCTYFGGQKLS